jgi:hypothetical protein
VHVAVAEGGKGDEGVVEGVGEADEIARGFRKPFNEVAPDCVRNGIAKNNK